jgi:hypothetical protein
MICENCNQPILHPDHICSYHTKNFRYGKVRPRRSLDYSKLNMYLKLLAWALIIGAFAVIMHGCSDNPPPTPGSTPPKPRNAISEYEEICLNGIVYYRPRSGRSDTVTVKYIHGTVNRVAECD